MDKGMANLFIKGVMFNFGFSNHMILQTVLILFGHHMDYILILHLHQLEHRNS